MLLGGSTIATLIWAIPYADCASEDEDAPENTDDKSTVAKPDEVERFINYTLMPMCNKLGFGGIAGFCSGVAVRHATQWLAYVSGMVFVALQVASYNGYVDIDWFKVQGQSKCPPIPE